VDPLPVARLPKLTRLLPLEFYARPTVEVAQALLGCIIVNEEEPGVTAGMIVETEAYLGADSSGQPDRAAHSYRGLTPRTGVIFGPPGRAYVYFIYGMHECLNVVAESDGVPGAVLIRALEPLTGLAIMAERRGGKGQTLPSLTNGPGKLTQALGVTRKDNGARLDQPPLTIREWKRKPEFAVEVTPRIGITQSTDLPLRFVWKENEFVSRTRQGAG
jgi:DNA-3-methyladenine glycosylase